MRFDAHYPIVSGYDRKPAFGYYFHIADPLQFRQLSASLAVSPYGVHGGERFHANVEYQTPNWKLTYWHNLADIYDLAGPVLRSRKGDAFIANYTKPLIYDPPRQLDLFGSAAAYFGLDQLPGAQNIAEPEGPALGRDRPPLHQHHQGAWRSRSRKGHRRARSSPAPTRRKGHFYPTALRRVRHRHRAAVAQQLGLALRPCRHGRRPARAARSPLIISARSATITSMTGPRSATARWRASRASRSTRSRRASSPG